MASVGEFGGEPLDTGAGRVTVVGQAAQELVGDRRRPDGHAATPAARAWAAGGGRVSRQWAVVPVSRRVIRSVAAQYRWDSLLPVQHGGAEGLLGHPPLGHRHAPLWSRVRAAPW
nr:hypothetical protein [Actinomadura madurae]